VVGAIHGQLSKAFGKIGKLHSKNDFSFAIVVGDLFGDVDSKGDLTLLLDGSLIVPLPIYFTVGDSALPAEVIARIESNVTNEVCPNLIYLGRKGTMKTTEGIRIVALGGRLVQSEASITKAIEKYDPLYQEADARGLYGAHTADILITNQWPAHIVNGSQSLPEILRTDQGSQSIAGLCSKLRPRYHFSSSPAASWDREPFRHPVEYGSQEVEPITRFRSLAGLAAGSAKDWMSAFNLDPNGPPPPAPNATPSPFTSSLVSRKRQMGSDNEPFARFSNGNGQAYSGRPPKRSRESRVSVPDECFMCVNKDDFQAHMLVSIGNESIITVPKGPLPLPKTFPDLSSSGHALIIPTYHAGDDLKNGPRPQQEVDVEFAEMTNFRKSLCKMLQSKAQGRLGAVCWEANRTGVRHLHWQFMAAPYDLIKKGLVEAGFRAYRENNEYPPFQSCDSDSRLEDVADYFRLWIWTPHITDSDPVKAVDEVKSAGGDSGSEKSMFFPIPVDQKFNLQFGREVMAKLLKLDARINWRDAEQPQMVEEQEALALRADFAKFDFAMNPSVADGEEQT
jgi:Protein similar to CwfJ C-terminus 1/Protein similar to CwfJ C-terminus 2